MTSIVTNALKLPVEAQQWLKSRKFHFKLKDGEIKPHDKDDDEELQESGFDEEIIRQKGAAPVNEAEEAANLKKLKEQEQLENEEQRQNKGDEFLLTGLVESEFIYGYLKKVFERRRQQQFLKALDQLIEKQKEDIHSLCSDHYEEFLRSVSNLKTVRAEAQKLKESIIELNDELQAAGREALETGNELLRYRMIGENIRAAMEATQNCLIVAELSAKANNQIREKKFYPALRTLDVLQKSLRKIYRYDFAKYLEKRIPIMKSEIKTSVQQDFNEWLTNIRQQSLQIGSMMMDNTKRRMAFQEDIRKRQQKLNTAEDIASLYTNYEEENVFEKVGVGFSPVYTAKHIHETLDAYEEFKNYYKTNREKQISLDLQNTPKDSYQDCSTYLARIVGFFVVEDAVLQSTTSLISSVEMNSLWDTARQNIKVVLQERLTYINNAYEFLKMKELVAVFSVTLQSSVGLHVAPLLEFLEDFKDHFARNLLEKAKTEIKKVVEDEKYDPMEIGGPEQYEILVEYHLQDPNDTKDIQFPITVAFSKTVPSLCIIVVQYIKDFFEFAKYLSDLDDTIKKGLDDLLKTINRTLDNLIDAAPSNYLSQHAQISINATYMAYACSYFEQEFISRSNRKIKTSEFLRSARNMFKQTRSRAEDMIFKAILNKITSLMDLCSPSWMPNSPPIEPSDYMQDLIRYLTTTFIMLDFLPSVVREAVQFKACQHIANLIMEMLAGGGIQQINRFGLEQLRLDIKHAEDFASTLPEKCQYCFSEISQLLTFILGENIDMTIDEEDMKRKYAKTGVTSVDKMNKLVAVLQKLKQPKDKKDKGLGSLRFKFTKQ